MDKTEPAFPVSTECEWTGMSIRDYFAAKAMNGIVSCRGKEQMVNNDIASNIAAMSYCIAKAMLETRK